MRKITQIQNKSREIPAMSQSTKLEWATGRRRRQLLRAAKADGGVSSWSAVQELTIATESQLQRPKDLTRRWQAEPCISASNHETGTARAVSDDAADEAANKLPNGAESGIACKQFTLKRVTYKCSRGQCTGETFNCRVSKKHYAKHVEQTHPGLLTEAEKADGLFKCATCGFVQCTTPKAAETHEAHCRSLPRAKQDERASTIRHGKTTSTKWKPHVSTISAMDTAASANIDLTDRLSQRVIDDFFKDKPIDTPHFLVMAGKTIQGIPRCYEFKTAGRFSCKRWPRECSRTALANVNNASMTLRSTHSKGSSSNCRPKSSRPKEYRDRRRYSCASHEHWEETSATTG